MKKQTISIFFLVLIAGLFNSSAQQWGLYTLYATKNGVQAYLIDTNNSVYKTWTFSSNQQSAYSTYMIPGDTLVRSYKPTSNTWNGGGIHGGIQKVTWNGTIAWDFQYYQSGSYCLHHDICPMPNGNVLMICYEVKSAADAIQAGCSQSTSLWAEKIIEVKPTGSTTGTIVWEWHLWDHLCQNYNASKDNYVTSIVNNPQLLNINYSAGPPGSDRWHMNGLDYNEDLDQIAISMHFTDELYVIDHSTSTAEAAGHTGGNSGKGGDFLYRWGNPVVYGASGSAAFDVIHDAHWISSDNPNYPDYLVGYNNNGGSGGSTAVTIWSPPYNGYNYNLTLGLAYDPPAYGYQYNAVFTANNEGNSQQLPNGNMIVNNSFGSIYEINSSGATIWTKNGANSSHAYRFTLCEVRGPVVSANSSSLEICEGDQINLTSSALSVTESSPSYTYAWTSDPPGFTSGSQNTTDTPSSNTTYTVEITNTLLGCSATAEVEVVVNPLPTPVISDFSYYLSSSAAVSYQWYLNASPLPGETGQTITLTQIGQYQVEVTDANGCSAMSAVYNVTTIGLDEGNFTKTLVVYPNPTTGLFHVDGDFCGNDWELIVTNISGSLIMHGFNEETVDLSEFPTGVYYLCIRVGNGTSVNKRIIVIR